MNFGFKYSYILYRYFNTHHTGLH